VHVFKEELFVIDFLLMEFNSWTHVTGRAQKGKCSFNTLPAHRIRLDIRESTADIYCAHLTRSSAQSEPLPCRRVPRALFAFSQHPPKSTTSEHTAMPGRVRRAEAAQDDTLDTLAEALDQHLPAVFTAAQHTTASHRKHINTLHAVFLRCAKVTTLSSDGRYTRLSGEKAFGEKFREMVTFPLGVKKGTDQADRVIKFIAGFVGFAIEYGESTRSDSLARRRC
jgi:hypothetical protein